MQKRNVIAVTLAIVMSVACLFSACSKSAKPGVRTKPLLSCLSDGELKNTLEELYVFVPNFHEPYTGVTVEGDPVERYLTSAKGVIRQMEYNIEFFPVVKTDASLYEYGELRRAVELYYGGELPGIRYYAVSGSPRYAKAGVKLSELDDAEFLSALKEHFFGNMTGYTPDTDTLRSVVKKLEEDPDAAYADVLPPEIEATAFLTQEELTVGELRRAVKLYYGYAPYDKPAERPNIYGEDGQKLTLSEMDEETLRAVLSELGVQEIFFEEEYSEEMHKTIVGYEHSENSGPKFGYSTAEAFMFDELFRAVNVYYSDIYPFGN